MEHKYKKIFFLIVSLAVFFILFPKTSFADPVLPPKELCRSMRMGDCCCVTGTLCIPWDKISTCAGEIMAAPCSQLSQCQGVTPTQAVFPEEKSKETPIKVPVLGISIPGLVFTSEESKLKICTVCKDAAVIDPAECPKEQCASWAYQIPWIGQYVSAFYKWAVGALAILAVIMIMISGIRWLIAGGSPEKISSARQGIVAAISGLIFILIVHQILAMINPELTILKPIVIGVIKRIEVPSQENIDVEAPPPTEPIPPGTNNIPLFKQWDSQWATHPFGICGTIKSSGCGPTSLAMVLKYYGQSVDPAIVAVRVAQNGFRACSQPVDPPKCTRCSGTAHAAFWGNNSIPKKVYGFTTAQYLGDKSAKDKILTLLQQGKPIIAAMGASIFTQHGHYIVLTSLDNSGNILINDPNKNISQATQDQVFCCLSAAFYIAP